MAGPAALSLGAARFRLAPEDRSNVFYANLLIAISGAYYNKR
jgi:hypothetical protein